jgi:hypothetical protein
MKKQLQKIQLLEAQISAFLEDTTEPLPPNRVMENPNFRKWFGNSVTVNSDGTPMVFYHGTGSNIVAFDKKMAHDKEGREYGVGTGKGVFSFTTDIDLANVWAERSLSRNDKYGSGANPNVNPVYLKIKNPITRLEFMNLLDNKFEGCSFRNQKTRDKFIAEIYRDLKSKKVDGIIDEYSGEYTVFSPNQIKSIYNNGQFSTTSNNISEASHYSDENKYRLTPVESTTAHALYEQARDVLFYADFIQEGTSKDVKRLLSYLMDALKSASQNGYIMFATQKQIKKIVATLLGYLEGAELSDDDRDALTELFLGLRDFNAALEGAEVVDVVDIDKKVI